MLIIQKLAAELGLNCITTYKLDALKAVSKRHESDNLITSNGADSNNHFTVSNSMNSCSDVEKSKGFPPHSFDRVFLDKSCSALGLRPQLFLERKP